MFVLAVSGLIDVLVSGLNSFLGWSIESISDGIAPFVRTLIHFLLYTPLPESSGRLFIFKKPPGMWGKIWSGFFGFSLPLSFIILGVSYIVSVLGESFGFISSYSMSKRRINILNGWILLPISYSVCILTIGFFDSLGHAFIREDTIDSLSSSMANSMFTSVVPGIGIGEILVLIIYILNIGIMFLATFLFGLRILLIPSLVYMFPILVGISISNLPIVSKISDKIITLFIKLAVIPFPIGVLINIQSILVDINIMENIGLPTSEILDVYIEWILAYTFPLVSALVYIYILRMDLTPIGRSGVYKMKNLTRYIKKQTQSKTNISNSKQKLDRYYKTNKDRDNRGISGIIGNKRPPSSGDNPALIKKQGNKDKIHLINISKKTSRPKIQGKSFGGKKNQGKKYITNKKTDNDGVSYNEKAWIEIKNKRQKRKRKNYKQFN